MTEPVAHETFDPYYKWLGISPKDQPPHYYRLLAIDSFESDEDVISAAADKQMAFIRSFQTGKDALLSQKILNEISTARICLLNAAKKAHYDATLRARMAAAGAASGLKKAKPLPFVATVPADEAEIAVAGPADANIFPLPMQSGGGERSQVCRKKSPKATVLPLVALGAMLVVCVVAFAVVMSRTPETQVSQTTEDPAGSRPGNAKPSHVEPATPGSKPPVPANTGGPAEADAAHAASGNKPNDKPSGENRPDIKPGIGDDPFAAKPEPAPKPNTPAEPAKAEKGKTPEELDKQLAAAKTPEDYQALAGEALRAAGKAIDDHQPDAARQLILKSLVAARKSGDSKLIVKATRALTRPETVKEILAEKDKQDEDSAADSRPPRESSPRPRTPADGTSEETPGTSGQQGPVVPVAKRIGLMGTNKLGALIGPVRQGTLITLQYDGGTWDNPVTHESINPDDTSQNVYRVAIATRDSSHTSLLPHDTAVRAFHWRADRDYDSLVLRCHISGANEPLGGKVYYRMTIKPPGP